MACFQLVFEHESPKEDLTSSEDVSSRPSIVGSHLVMSGPFSVALYPTHRSKDFFGSFK